MPFSIQIRWKNGGCRERVNDSTLNFNEVYKNMDNYYNLESFVSGCLMFTWVSYGERGSEKEIKFVPGYGIIEDHWVNENIFARRRPLKLSDLDLQVEMQKGDEGEQDVSCNWNFMLGFMEEIWNDTRSTQHSIGVVEEEIIYLVTDNTVGHGKNEAVLEYSEYLVVN